MMPAPVRAAFQAQSKACAGLGSPFMASLMHLCATRDWPQSGVTDRLRLWEGDLGPRAQSVPLRISGALHALVLKGHPDLGAVYPPHPVDADRLWAAICVALVEEAAFVDAFIDNPPQTNEVRRSAALIAVGHFLAERYDLPIRTSELGASGGLNLHWDSYALKAAGQLRGPDNPVLTLSPDWHGPALPIVPPCVVSRGGVDISPLDPSRDSDALRLQAYLWPDQPDRLALTHAAIGAATTRVDEGCAIGSLTPRLPHQSGTLHLVYSTIAWQYFSPGKQAEGAAAIAEAGARATDDTPLAWFGMEQDDAGPGAALTLRLWPDAITLDLGRADFHGRWFDWRPL